MDGDPTSFVGAPEAGGTWPLSDQQEAFCRAYVYYGNAAYAAREAGYAPESARQMGHKLLKRPNITAEVLRIRQEMAREGCTETATLLGKLESVYNKALEDRAYYAASRTVEIQARLAGLMPSLHERGQALSASPDETAES